MPDHHPNSRVIEATETTRTGPRTVVKAPDKGAEKTQHRPHRRVIEAAQIARAGARTPADAPDGGAEKAQPRTEPMTQNSPHVAEQATRAGADLAIRSAAEQIRREANKARVPFAPQNRQAALQGTDQTSDLARQVANSAASNYQAVWSELAKHTRQAVQRTLNAFTQATQAPTPIALLSVQNRYLADSLQAVLATNIRLTGIAADMAGRTANKIMRRTT